MRSIAAVLDDIEGFVPDEAVGNTWLRLQDLLDELFACGEELGVAVEPLIRVLERFPKHDGYGVFWSIVHGLESIPGYEPALVASVQRSPTEFTLTMVRRLRNSGVERVCQVDLASLSAALGSKLGRPEVA